MKYLSTFFVIGLALPLSFLNAENAFPAESISPLSEEIAFVTQPEEERSFLDEEFETEFVSLGETPPNSAEPLVVEVTAPVVVTEPKNTFAVEQESDLFTEKELAETESPSLLEQNDLESIGLELSLNEELSAPLADSAHITSSGITVDLKQAFRGSPIIYSVLIGMSIFSVCLWLYSLASIRLSTHVPSSLVRDVQNQLNSNNFSEALNLCTSHHNLLSKMLATGIQSRRYGLPMVVESMKAEAKRSTVFFWQKLGLLNDIAIIAPMLGLLGTVMGMFYAFYDVNRSIESISTLFDGLGISVGTTVAGLVVAIVALILHSTAKYRLVRALAKVENQAQRMVPLLDDKTHIHKG